MILLRTTEVTPPVLDLADRLGAASGLPVSMLVDERHGSVGPSRHPKLVLDADSYASLGLHLPTDVGWRCGDYGFYLARRVHPEVERFWMIEFDVRLTGDAALFFDAAAKRSDLDLLAGRLQPADRNWWWFAHLASADARPWRCFFPVIRLSARAIDQLYAKRRDHSRTLSRIALWPNDEAFVATTVVHEGLRRDDLNDLGPFYDDETFSYENLLRDEGADTGTGPPRLLHPVLDGERYTRKYARMQAAYRLDPLPFRVRRALVRRVNGFCAW